MGNMRGSDRVSHEVFVHHARHVFGVAVVTPAALCRKRVVHINCVALHDSYLLFA